MSSQEEIKALYVACLFVLVRLKSLQNRYFGTFTRRHKHEIMKELKHVSRHKRFYF